MSKVTFSILLAIAFTGTTLSFEASAACFDPKVPFSAASVSGYDMSVAEEIGLTKVIAIGKVIASRNIPIPEDPESYETTIYTVQIERVIKGNLPSQVRLSSSNTTARYWMEVGERHILFLTREWKENRGMADYYVDNCGNSSTLPKGDAVVKQVETTLNQHSSRARSAPPPSDKAGERVLAPRAAPNTSLEWTRDR